jgi:hypothetical protein
VGAGGSTVVEFPAEAGTMPPAFAPTGCANPSTSPTSTPIAATSAHVMGMAVTSSAGETFAALPKVSSSGVR